MREIEIKILEIDRDAVSAALAALGAAQTFDGTMHALYYDLPGSPLKERGDALRLRLEGERAVLALKRHVEDGKAKVREELEVAVADFDAMRTLLGSLGFAVWLEMKKHRTRYSLGEVHFDLDRYEDMHAYIPEFLEIEGPDTETVFRHAELLGFRREDCRPWDAVRLAGYYAARRAS
ncbi:MAG: hypothetical protein OHK006_18190 [Thermodesulfovibrionales bacterium]